MNTDERDLDTLERRAFAYFADQVLPSNGLIRDSTRPGAPASIAAVGLALAGYPVAVERGYLGRAEGRARAVDTLRFFRDAPQGAGPAATGHRGLYYHFLDPDSGLRAWSCELSTIDTALLLAGGLVAAEYFGDPELRQLAEELYHRADWDWARDGGPTITHGWTPEGGFLPHRWRGYDEATVLYLLALGSPTHPVPRESYDAYTATYSWKRAYDIDYLYAGPLFVHQYSHLFVDFRGIADAPMRARGTDYFENSRRATLVHQRYAIANPLQFRYVCSCCWGWTACEGPGPATLLVEGVERRFYDYLARGAPFGPDDGTIAPWAAVASLPFAPDVVLPTVRHMLDLGLAQGAPCCEYGLAASFNPTFPTSSPLGWVSPYQYGLNVGPMLLMIENHRSELLWRLTRANRWFTEGLRRAGFSGGWLAP